MSVLSASDSEYIRKLDTCDRSACLAIVKEINALLRSRRVTEEQIHVLLRRQAKAEKRMQALGDINKTTQDEYRAWRRREC